MCTYLTLLWGCAARIVPHSCSISRIRCPQTPHLFVSPPISISCHVVQMLVNLHCSLLASVLFFTALSPSLYHLAAPYVKHFHAAAPGMRQMVAGMLPCLGAVSLRSSAAGVCAARATKQVAQEAGQAPVCHVAISPLLFLVVSVPCGLCPQLNISIGLLRVAAVLSPAPHTASWLGLPAGSYLWSSRAGQHT